MRKPIRERIHSGALTIGAALLATVAWVGCAMNPVTGEREFVRVTEAQEIGMGRQGTAEVTAAIGPVQAAELRSYVTGVGQGLSRESERPQLAWEFHVSDDAPVNAFAMPGGFNFVTRVC